MNWLSQSSVLIWIHRINQIPIFWLLLVLLICNKAGFDVSGGEEHYMSFAKQFYDPQWIPGSFTFTEFPGSRWLFQWIVGWALQYISIEWMVFIGRILNFVLYAHALSLIARKLQLAPIALFVGFQLFLIVPQSFFASAWMFVSFEPKTLAYAACLYAIYFALKEAYSRTFISLAIATYFHFLVGGWLSLTMLLYLLYFGKGSTAVKHLGIYSLLTAPLFYFIGHHLITSASSNMIPSAHWIYSYYRLPHHLGIFANWDYFASTQLLGILWMIAALLFFVFLHKDRAQPFQLLIRLSYITAILLLPSMIIGFLDGIVFDQAAWPMLKLYPYRPNVWIKFFFAITFSQIAYDWLRQSSRGQQAILLVCFLFLPLFIAQTANNVKRSKRYYERSQYWNLIEYMQTSMQPGDTFVSLNIPEKDRLPLGRLTRCDPYAEWKFVPAGTSKTGEWYDRLQMITKWENLDTVRTIPQSIDWVVTTKNKTLIGFDRRISFGDFEIYARKKE